MKLLHPVLLLTFVLSAGSAMAQTERAPSEAPTAEQRLAEDYGVERLPGSSIVVPSAGNGKNVSTLQQNGHDNTAQVDQQTLSALGNQAYVTQAGAFNTLNVNQMGGGNLVNLTQNGNNNTAGYTQDGQGNNSTITQKGSNNKLQGLTTNSDFLLRGDNNTMKITQEGSGNVLKGEVHESNRNYTIRQNGSNNTLTQIESTFQSPQGYTVEMKGQGINITIEQGKVGH